MQKRLPKNVILPLLLLLYSKGSFAHGFGGTGHLAPLIGIDHLIASLAMGMWSSKIGGKTICILPGFFLILIIAQDYLEVMPIPVARADLMAAGSTILFGLAMLSNQKTSLIAAGIGVFAFGLDLQKALVSGISFSAGRLNHFILFLTTIFGVYSAGVIVGLLVLEEKKRNALPFIGAAFFLIGGFLILFIKN